MNSTPAGDAPEEPDELDRLAADAFAMAPVADAAAAHLASAARRAEVLGAAHTARTAGPSLASPLSASSADDIHRRLAADADALVRSLDPADLVVPTRLGHDVRTVLAHLVGQLTLGADALDPAIDDASPASSEPDSDYDHWEATGIQRAALAAASPDELADALAAVNRRIVDRLAASTAPDASTGRDAGVGRALVKSFELWMHADDVRLALGLPLTTPDAATVLALCRLATGLLPSGMAAVGQARAARTVRIVLTGAGGGTWRCPGAPDEAAGGDDDAVLVADAVTFCRLFHQQVAADAVPLAVEGDHDLVAAALAGAQAFAERT